MCKYLLFTFGIIFIPEVFAQVCTPQPGYYCTGLAEPPTVCPPGHYCTGSPSNVATMCPSGTYNPNSMASSIADCIACPLYEVPTVDKTQCVVCQIGYRYMFPDANTPGTCALCPNGSSSYLNSTICNVCQPGYFGDVNGLCNYCRPGTYSDIAGLSECSSCAPGKYTYNTSIDGKYTALWGSDSETQCRDLPGAGMPLVCLPGTYRSSISVCSKCPKGYYCPIMTELFSDRGSIRVCPDGKYTLQTGAMVSADCTLNSQFPLSYEYKTCMLSKDDTPSLGSKSITCMASSLNRDVVYFATKTAIYRLFIVQTNVPNSVDLIVGQEGVSGNGNVVNAVGIDARFTDISAIGVDLDGTAASVVVVGDGNAIRMIHIYTREVILLGNPGIVQRAGGIALARSSLGSMIAYVSDMVQNRIMGFHLGSRQSFLIAGDSNGASGNKDGFLTGGLFWKPMGLCFLEINMNASRTLLVADSMNNMIRAVDVDTRIVTTFFRSLDKMQPEINNPVGLFVMKETLQSNSKTIIFIAENSDKIKVLSFPTSDNTLKSINVLSLPGNLGFNVSHISTTGKLTSYVIDYKAYHQIVALDSNLNTIRTVIEKNTAETPDATEGSLCHIPCKQMSCGALQQTDLCGNSFLEDATDEECDNANKSGGGCDDQCRIRAGFTCPTPFSKCADPCVGYNYTFEDKMYCEVDCMVKTPRKGYTIDNYCVETDIDECDLYEHTCDSRFAYCDNIPGSYTCKCFNSYFGDGRVCKSTAYTVYTVVEIPTLGRVDFLVNRDIEGDLVSESKEAFITNFKNAFADTLIANMEASFIAQNTFNESVIDLARKNTFISLDPNTMNMAKIEISTLFETYDMALHAASKSSKAQIGLALSKSLFGASATAGATVIQNCKTRVHIAGSMGSVEMIEGWGMNITSVSFNRSCSVAGVASRGGCWEIEMIYVGGASMPKGGDTSGRIQSSKNVLYLPRIDRDPVTLDLIDPSQMLVMTSGASFPCDTSSSAFSGTGITSKSTACCLRAVNRTYRTNSRFSSFLNSNEYVTNVPEQVCMNGLINETYPDANIVYIDPENDYDGSTNDLVVGKIEGMPHSEVRLLETIDYTSRTFRILLSLEEGDLRESGALIQGIVGLEYNMSFFVGLANFGSLSGSVMTSRNMQMKISVSKSNVLTLSSYGANQDPLVNSVTMSMSRIKVTDFFNPIRYLYVLRPKFTMPGIYGSPDNGQIVPISSIRVIKGRGTVSASDVNWMQACDSEYGTDIWANSSLQELVRLAQRQECVGQNLYVCSPPETASNIVEFGIALPEGFLTNDDFIDSNPLSLQVEFMINAKDSVSKTNVRTSLSMGIELVNNGYIQICESRQASQNLADIIQGNIYIGIASDANEWVNSVLKKTNMDVPGNVPSDSFEFNTVTLQGAVMTFAALGSPAYFDDVRNYGQYVHIHDLHSVHFLEPNGGKGGQSPKFESVKTLFLNGKAFVPKSDPINKISWLEPSTSLLNLCPRVPNSNSKTCITRLDSTIKNNVLNKPVGIVSEIFVNDNSSVANMQKFIADVMFKGGETAYTKQTGRLFHDQLVTQLKLNNRYRRAYSVNPVINWALDAIQSQFPSATSYTVCSKIIAIGMITIYSSGGAPVARRLLSTQYINHRINAFDAFAKEHGKLLTHTPFTLSTSDLFYSKKFRRNLLQSSTDTYALSPTKEQTSNSMVLDLEIPEFDTITQLCGIYVNAPFWRCNVLEIKTIVRDLNAMNICEQNLQGNLALTLDSGMKTTLRNMIPTSNINDISLLEYSVENCPDLIPDNGRRRLLSATNYAIQLTTTVLVSSNNGSSTIYQKALQNIANFLNAEFATTILGGGGYIDVVTIDFGNPGENRVNVTFHIKNNTIPNRSTIVDLVKKSPDWNPSDTMFIGEDTEFKGPSSTANIVTNSMCVTMLNIVSIYCIFYIFIMN